MLSDPEAQGNAAEPGTPGNLIKLTDPRMMRALAHPARIAIWMHLGLRGPATATQCADVAGLSPSACSYHLRALARYGFVEEDKESAADGRQRPWRARLLAFTIEADPGKPATTLAAEQLLQETVRSAAEEIRAQYADRRSEYPFEWRSAAGEVVVVAHVTAQELDELRERVRQLFDRQAPRQVSPWAPAAPAARPVLLPPAGRPRRPGGQYWIRRRWTWLQRAGGVLIACACVAGAAWYVPRVMSDDSKLLTGTVTSSGVVTLNFAYPGQISKVGVRPGQWVRKGQVLAAEYDPDAASVVAADKAAIASAQAAIALAQAAIASAQAKIAELKTAEAADPAAAAADNAQLAADNAQLAAEKTQLAAGQAQLAADQAQLATDREKVVATEIVAPSSGVVVACNGQPGQTVTSAGIRDYAADSQQAPAAQGPQFSLLPESPQTVHRVPAGQSALPVIALRTSAAWQVVALIPEDSVSGIKPGQIVTVSVPSAHITGVPGQIAEVAPTPVSTSEGVFYQAAVTIASHTQNLPLNGMAADIRLGS